MTQMPRPYEEVFSPFEPKVADEGQDGDTNGYVVPARTKVMMKLIADLPTNELGLYDYIFRADLIPPSLFDEDVTESERFAILQTATYPLDYSEGYPCQMNGTAFWSQLSFEPMAAYNIFMQYLGVVKREDADGVISAPIRTLSFIAHTTGISENRLRDMAYLYYWNARAKAYDQFMLANFQKQREQRAMFIEDDHFRKASRWIKKAEERLETIFEDEDLLYDMKPKEVFNMLKELMVIQRVSSGLPANGPLDGIEGTRNANLQQLLKVIAKSSGEVARVADSQEMLLEAFLEDGDNLEKLQELIINAGSAHTKPKKHQGGNLSKPAEDAEVTDVGNT